jgi:hypothetical protein
VNTVDRIRQRDKHHTKQILFNKHRVAYRHSRRAKRGCQQQWRRRRRCSESRTTQIDDVTNDGRGGGALTRTGLKCVELHIDREILLIIIFYC